MTTYSRLLINQAMLTCFRKWIPQTAKRTTQIGSHGLYYDLHDALQEKNVNEFWKFWRSKFEYYNGCKEVDVPLLIILSTRMWANAQRDGRPAEYRCRSLFNAAKFGWRPLLECRAVTLPRREAHWNLLGCPKLANRSQPLVGRSSYCEDMWGRHCCLIPFSDCR